MKGVAGLALGAAWLLAGAAAAEVAPAAGGARLLAAAEDAPEVVVARVGDVERLDLHGWRASVVVERALTGPRAAESPLAVGWEELGGERPARFTSGGLVVFALEPLPPGSLWTQRFPKRDGRAIAARGEAFLRDPDPATLEPLARWLALAPPDRDSPAGVAALAALAAAGDPVVAASAVARLERVPDLPERAAGAATESLSALVRDAARPESLRRAALELVSARGLRTLEPTLETLAAAPSSLQGAAVDALAQLRGGLAPERTAELLAASDPALRAAAVRRGDLETGALRGLLARDSADEVRAAAADALAARADPASADDFVSALGDPASSVRLAALRGIGEIGPDALPALQREVWEANPRARGDAVPTAVLALGLIGPAGASELKRIAHEHPSERVRRLAELALGKLPDEH